MYVYARGCAESHHCTLTPYTLCYVPRIVAVVARDVVKNMLRANRGNCSRGMSASSPLVWALVSCIYKITTTVGSIIVSMVRSSYLLWYISKNACCDPLMVGVPHHFEPHRPRQIQLAYHCLCLLCRVSCAVVRTI